MSKPNFSSRREVSVSRLHELLEYNPVTGVFTWRVDRGANKTRGKPAGSKTAKGYVVITIDKVGFFAHRAAVAMTTGAWPESEVDHRNVDPSDNRWCNLRILDRGGNMQNKRQAPTNSKSGLLGVGRHRNKWRVKICPPGQRQRSVYGFATAELAHEFYVLLKELVHPGYVPLDN